MVKSAPTQLSIFDLPTFQDLINATSSQASAAGLTRSGLRAGLTTGLCGRAVAPANPSPSPVKAAELTTSATCGRTSTASFAPADPLSLWENRLRERLGTDGSMECELIWKEVATPAGRQIFRLSRSTPRTFASGSTGSPSTWWTPKASQTMGRYSRVNGKIYPGLWMQAEGSVATWPTPTKADGDGGHVMGTASATGKRENGTKITVSLPGVVKIVSTWPTPTLPNEGRSIAHADEWRGNTPYCKGKKIQVDLAQVARAMWPTPCASDDRDRGALGRPGDPASGCDGQATDAVDAGAGFWGHYEWAIGADGKARRVEPSIRLLAHGVPARVGKLRAYGNAIVPQVAAEVVKALMETLDV